MQDMSGSDAGEALRKALLENPDQARAIIENLAAQAHIDAQIDTVASQVAEAFGLPKDEVLGWFQRITGLPKQV
jgi:hypothetical protein